LLELAKFQKIGRMLVVMLLMVPCR
jgi:hypothetical protein